jgi:hypothetical protein
VPIGIEHLTQKKFDEIRNEDEARLKRQPNAGRLKLPKR